MSYDETDSVVDEFRERMVLAREHMAEFAQPEPPLECVVCLQPIDFGAICPKCDLWDVGIYEENLWGYSE